jgi:hypothetical protein
LLRDVIFYSTFVKNLFYTLMRPIINLSIIMGLILTEQVLTMCEGEEMNSYSNPVIIETKCASRSFHLYDLTVTARQWHKLSNTDRYLAVRVPTITSKIIKKGAVIIYLNEAGKNLALPFTYYQLRKAMSFQPSYDEGHVYINILGNFILNVHTSYSFSILVIDADGLLQFKNVDWYNYAEVKKILGLT